MATDYVKRLAEESLKPSDANKIPLLKKILTDSLQSVAADSVELAAELESRPDVQAQLASVTGYTPSRWLLDCELEHVKTRRSNLEIPAVVPDAEPRSPAYERARKSGLMGLCFSGGGIRSASFNLGVLQGLAELKLLKYFDYLSSVSGGGYIHQWLAAWSKRCSFAEVNKQLIPLPDTGNPGTHPEPIRWLRRYSNYLTPQTGLLSADTWVAFATWLRNTLLNLMILISGMLVVILLPHIVAFNALIPRSKPVAALLIGGTCCLSLWASWGVAKNLSLLRGPGAGEEHSSGQGAVQAWMVLPMLLAALLLSLLMDMISAVPFGVNLALVFCGSMGLLAVLTLMIIFGGAAPLSFLRSHQNTAQFASVAAFWRQKPKCIAHVKFAIVIGAFLFVVMFSAFFGAVWIVASMVLVAHLWGQIGLHWWRAVVVLLPPLILAGALITMLFVLGLLGRTFTNERREWMARLTGWMGLYSLGWVFFSGFSLFGHWIVELLLVKVVAGVPALVAWIGGSVGGLLAGKNSKSTGATDDKAPSKFGTLEILAIVGPYVFIAGMALVIAWFADELLGKALQAGPWEVFLTFTVPLVICGLFAWRVDVNEFSMHAFYRDRLARCYLGASNLNRQPNPFTGFDGDDTNIAVGDLLPVDEKKVSGKNEDDPKKGYNGPFPIFCTALNLTFGEDLAWQERKAASFVFTPLYSGYDVGWTAARGDSNLRFNGYVKTASYAYPPEGVHISTAVAISGAALSPNWGYHSNPATAFLLTVFNARLGWWLRNPRTLSEDGKTLQLAGDDPCRKDGKLELMLEKDKHPWPSPHFSLFALINELLGQSNDTTDYVYLTDGGHFDNMGLYELVRRRCRYIVICDAEADGDLQFSGIGMAIRKCRIDFGAEISLDLRPLTHIGDTQLSSTHCVTGTIRYPEDPPVDPEHHEYPGTVVYIKSSLTGDEPSDIVNYKKEHPSFPHDTTLNQWFTESQFESYRRLGHHVAYSVFAPASPPAGPPASPNPLPCETSDGRSKYFSNLRHIWCLPTPEMDRYGSTHTTRYLALLVRIRDDKHLPGFFDRLFIPGLHAWKQGRSKEECEYAVRFSYDLIEFMWTVFTDLNLVLTENRSHPYAYGWCAMFKVWAGIDAVQDAWSKYGMTYSQRFRNFAESTDIGLRPVSPGPCSPAA
jgi:hypothetical protein